MNSKYILFLAMLVVAIVAVGSVSAAENATIDIADEPADDIIIEDVEADDVDESASDVETDDITADVNDENQGTRQNYDVDENTISIQDVIDDRETTTHVVSFKPITYNNVALTIHGNVNLIGNGATLIGGTGNIFAIDNATNFTVTGFNIITPNTKAAFYGANVNDSKITNNNISGGKDGINIKESYRNVTVTGNTITGFTRDGISLVNHDIIDDLDNFDASTVSNNRVSGGEVGLFFGGNFKGDIQNNIIDNSPNGIEFNGKPIGTLKDIMGTIANNAISNATNGIVFINETLVDLTMNSNNFSRMTTGINMLNTIVTDLTMSDNNIINSGYGIYMTNVTTTSFNINSNNFDQLTSALNVFESNLNGFNFDSNDVSNMAAGVIIQNTAISDSTFDSNVFTGMGMGISMYRSTIDNTTINSNDFTYVNYGIKVATTTLNSLNIAYNNMTGVNIGIILDDLNLTSLYILENVIRANSGQYVIFGEEIDITSSEGDIEVIGNYLYGKVNRYFFDLAFFENEVEPEVVD